MPDCVILRFFRGRGLRAWLVRFVTRSAYAHVDLVIPGVGVIDVRPQVGACLTPEAQAPTDFIETIIIDVQREVSLACAVAWLTSELPTPYDYLGAIAAGVPALAREHPERWFCSELIVEFLSRAHIGPIATRQSWRFTPEMLRIFYTKDSGLWK